MNITPLLSLLPTKARSAVKNLDWDVLREISQGCTLVLTQTGDKNYRTSKVFYPSYIPTEIVYIVDKILSVDRILLINKCYLAKANRKGLTDLIPIPPETWNAQ